MQISGYHCGSPHWDCTSVAFKGKYVSLLPPCLLLRMAWPLSPRTSIFPQNVPSPLSPPQTLYHSLFSTQCLSFCILLRHSTPIFLHQYPLWLQSPSWTLFCLQSPVGENSFQKARQAILCKRGLAGRGRITHTCPLPTFLP